MIYYAVKANPASPILKKLVTLGSRFDAASLLEVERCLEVGVVPQHISYGNTIKKLDDIAAAYDLGVRLFAFDSEHDLKKIAVLVFRPHLGQIISDFTSVFDPKILAKP